MKNKFLSLVLSFAMIATSFAFAVQPVVADELTDTDVTVTEVEQNSENNEIIEENSEVDSETIVEENNEGTEAPAADENEPVEESAPVNTENNEAVEENVSEEPVAEQENEVKEEIPAQAEQKNLNAAENNDKTAVAEEESEAEPVMPETVNVTKAGPFMDPVETNAQPVRMFRMLKSSGDSNPDSDGNGLALTKKAELQSDKETCKITMEAWTTGKVETNEVSVPVDVTIVLDQSGSMNENFDTNEFGRKIKRQEAMKTSINYFIDNVASKYTENADHRISLVEFRGGAEVLKGWTAADAKGTKALKAKVNSLDAEGATNVGAGMQKAETLMGSQYNYTGTHTERQKVVIVFTDGVPTTSNEFHTGVANTAITSAKNLKDSGCTVYTVGIFKGANPDELYGASGHAGNSNGKVGSVWYDKSGWLSGDIGFQDIPAGNRFLNYLSSNYENTTKIGIKEYFQLGLFKNDVGWEITQNFDRTAPDSQDYYLSASNAKALDEIFKTIAEQIQTPTIDLGTNTVVRDIVTEQFDMPANTSDIKVYTANFNGTEFLDRVPAEGVNVSMDGRTVEVDGFDYNKNFVSKEAKTDGTHGSKLIIEFDVTVRDGFLGGNLVATNGADSGVYLNDAKVETFEVPRVDIPLASFKSEAEDINVYLNANITKEVIAGNSGFYFDHPITSNHIVSQEFTGLHPWQKAYVDFDETISGEVTNIKNDSTYTITGQLKNKFYGSVPDGEVVEKTGKINVFKPEVTFKDINGYYGDKLPALETAYVNTTWKHGDVKDNDEGVNMASAKPDVNYVYSELGAYTSGEFIDTPNDIPVGVTAKMGKENITDYTTFKHQACNPDCGYEAGDYAKFLVHVKTCTLEVDKNVTGGNPEGQQFMLKLTGKTNLGDKNLEVVVKPEATSAGTYTDKLVIKGLPVGTYTVAENEDWAWRYNVTYDPGKAELKSAKPDGKLVVNNNKTTNNWLGGFTAIENIFDAVDNIPR